MLLRAQKVGGAAKNTAKQAVKTSAGNAVDRAAATPSFTMQTLWRQALWGSAAATALLVAILSTRSDVGAQRADVMLSTSRPASSASPRVAQANGHQASQTASSGAARPFDAEAATQQLTQAVRGLTEDRDRLTARLAAVEHNLDDMTGSIRSEIEAVKTAGRGEPPAGAAPSTVAVVAAPVMPAAAGAATPTPSASHSEAKAPTAPAQPEYGVDLGSGPSISALRVRWNVIASAHAHLFAAMTPVVAVREESGQAELHLVAGPMATPQAAAQLCAALAPFRLACHPSRYDGQRLAVR
jgi:hypothetical protein